MMSAVCPAGEVDEKMACSDGGQAARRARDRADLLAASSVSP